MKEKTLLFRYEELVYSDGSVEKRLISPEKDGEEAGYINLNRISEDAGQMLVIVRDMEDRYEKLGSKDRVTFINNMTLELSESIRAAADAYNTSVRDVITTISYSMRQLNGEDITLNYFARIMVDYLAGTRISGYTVCKNKYKHTSEIEIIMLENVFAKTEDKRAIKLYFSSKKFPLLLPNGTMRY